MLNTNEKIIKHKVGLLNLAEELGNCKSSKDLGHNSLKVKRDFHTL